MRTRRFLGGLLATLVSVAGLQLAAMAPASAAALTTVGFNISRPHLGDTAVRYTWTFTTATSGTLSKVDMTVPTGTAGATLTVTDAYGVPSGGTATLSGTTVTYTLATATSVGASVKVLLAIDGFTNTSTPGTYTSSVQTWNNAATPAVVDGPTSSASVTINDNNTPATVVIARSTSFTNSATTQTLVLDPTTATSSTAALTLTIKCNGANGYSLNVKATSMSDTQSDTIAAVSTGVATGVASGSFTTDRWGYTMTKSGVGVLQGALATAGNYVGYTTAGENAVVATGVAASDTITLTNQVKVDYAQDAGTYSSTVTYLVTPSY